MAIGTTYCREKPFAVLDQRRLYLEFILVRRLGRLRPIFERRLRGGDEIGKWPQRKFGPGNLDIKFRASANLEKTDRDLVDAFGQFHAAAGRLGGMSAVVI